jgi:hypothetical protein
MGALSRPSSFWDSYVSLLGVLLAALVLFPFVATRPVVWAVKIGLVVAAIIISYRASGSGTQVVTWVTVGALVLGAILTAAVFSPSNTVAGLINLALAALIGSGPIAILRHVYSQPRVKMQDIVGALDAYIEFGFFFSFLYAAVDQFTTEPFFSQTADPALFDYLYFSFVTMTSLGYGDLSPALAVGKGLVIVEVLLGSIFLVVLVARLVGTLGMERPRRAAQPEGNSAAENESDPD